MKSTAALIAATANGGDHAARIGRLADLIERAAGNPAAGLPGVNHGEVQAVGVHSMSGCPRHALLTFIDGNGVSHAIILTHARLVEFTDSLLALKRIERPRRAPGAPVTKPSGHML